MKSQLLPIFPEPLVEYKELGVDDDMLEDLYDQQEWKGTNASDNSDYFLKISKNMYVLDDVPEIKQLFESVINEYTKNFMAYENQFYLTTSWFTRTEKNKISVLHNHGNSMFSAVYYFGLPPGMNAQITFERPSTSQFDIIPTTYNVLNGPSHVFDLGNGSMLIFPSYLKHKVNRHENEGIRKSLAMNFIPQGVLGADTNEITLLKPEK